MKNKFFILLFVIIIITFTLISISAKKEAELLPPVNLMVPPLAISESSVTIIWSKPTNYANISSYEVYLNDKLVGTTEKLNYTINGLSPDTSYTIYVKSKDNKNNTSKESEKIVVKTVVKQPVINIKDYGAIGDGKTLNTKAIQKAIDEAAENSIILIPEGKFLSGAIFLKSNITLQIDGTLLGSDNIEDYPYTSKRLSYYTPLNYMGLINAYTEEYGKLQNIKIIGKGTVDGGTLSSDPTLTVLGMAQMKAKENRARADLITVKGVTNFYLGGIKIVNPAEHTIYISYSKNITIDGIDVRTYDIANGDGVDFAVSENIYLFNSFFDTGDDCINFNAGYGQEGVNEGISCKDVRIFNCTTQRGHGAVAFGSYTAGWIKNVLIEDCVFDGTDMGIRFKTSKYNGGGADNVLIRDIKMKNIVKEAITFSSNYSRTGTPSKTYAVFKNVTIKNVYCNGATLGIFIEGTYDAYHSNLTFEDILLENCNGGASIKYLKDSVFKNVKITGKGKIKWVNLDIENVKFINCSPKVSKM